MIYKLHCVICGSIFETHKLSQKTCSSKCSAANDASSSNRNIMATKSCICTICGKPFMGANTTTKYCPLCRSKPYLGQWQDDIARYRRLQLDGLLLPPVKHCKKCGRLIPDEYSFGAYCSLECAGISREPSKDNKPLEDYAAKQRRENPKRYADGQHLDVLLGMKKRKK